MISEIAIEKVYLAIIYRNFNSFISFHQYIPETSINQNRQQSKI